MRLAHDVIARELGTAEMQPARSREDHLVTARHHDVPTLRIGEIRHQETVVLARGNAGERARCIAAQTIGDQPLARA
jgi:hypothetical protein